MAITQRHGKFTAFALFAKYLCAQLFEELRYLLLKPLIYACPSKHRSLLLQLRKYGYVVVKGYYSEAEIAAINIEIDRSIRPLLSESHPGLSKLPGSTRFRRPEKKSFLFKTLTREIYWIAIHALYIGALRAPVLMLSFTEHLESKDSSDILKSDQEFFADHPHFDSYKHELKVVVALSDVTEESGPTEIAISSSQYHLKYWREYFSSWLSHRGLMEDKTKTISKEFYQGIFHLDKILLSAGDVALFDSRNIHRATRLIHGKRDLLWYYF